jgi:hypothetical protein
VEVLLFSPQIKTNGRRPTLATAPPSRRASADVGAIEYIGVPVPNTQIDVATTSRQLSQLRDDVDHLLARLATAESLWSCWLTGVATQNLSSSRNMLHYWAIRQSDLRDLQARLAAYGLSSLGRSDLMSRPPCSW